MQKITSAFSDLLLQVTSSPMALRPIKIVCVCLFSYVFSCFCGGLYFIISDHFFANEQFTDTLYSKTEIVNE